MAVFRTGKLERITTLILACSMLAGSTSLSGCSLGLNLLHLNEPRSDTAVLVLPGLRNSSRGMRAMRSFYPQHGFDVYIPAYYSKEGMDETVDNLARYIEEHRLGEYDRIYAMVYLMGGRALNLYLQDHELPNLTHIVYDRSPLQEQAPRIVAAAMPSTVRTFYGSTLTEFAATDYPPLPRGDRQIGIIVECKATSFIRRHRDDLDPVVPEDYLPAAFQQEHDDIIYVFRDHDQMYYSFDEIGADLLSFFDRGQFTEEATRTPCLRDPFGRAP